MAGVANLPKRREAKRDPLEMRVIEAVREAVLFLPREHVPMPGPSYRDGEDEIIGAMLDGDAKPSNLAPLEAGHFFSLFAATAFTCASALELEGTPISLDTLTDKLLAVGMCGPVRVELEGIARLPFQLPARLKTTAERIMRHWHERQLLEEMAQIDSAVRAGVLGVDGAKVRLREFFMGPTR